MSLQEIVGSLIQTVPGVQDALPTWDDDHEQWMTFHAACYHDIDAETARRIVDGVCCRWLLERDLVFTRNSGERGDWRLSQSLGGGKWRMTYYRGDFTEAVALACVAIEGGA